MYVCMYIRMHVHAAEDINYGTLYEHVRTWAEVVDVRTQTTLIGSYF